MTDMTDEDSTRDKTVEYRTFTCFVDTVDDALIWIAQHLERYKLENPKAGFETAPFQDEPDMEPRMRLHVMYQGTTTHE